MVNLFVSSLDYSVTQKDLFTLFKPYGYIKKVSVPVDKETGKIRGFAFVEIDAPDVAPIIDELNGKELNGRTIVVRLSEDKRSGDSSHNSNGPRPRTSSYNEGYKPRVSNNEEGEAHKSYERENDDNVIPKSNAIPKKKKSGKKEKDSTSDGNRKLKMSAYKKTRKNDSFIDDDDEDIDMEDFY